LKKHFDESTYPTQAALYSLALVKALQIKDEATYNRLVGGYAYCFVRHMADGSPHSVVYGRLSWTELQEFERNLNREEAA